MSIITNKPQPKIRKIELIPGRWLKEGSDWYCSNCHKKVTIVSMFCPSCRSKNGISRK